jgi:peptidoglycan/xylan/chitin deacetylase (PgdA/CDA1 family)
MRDILYKSLNFFSPVFNKLNNNKLRVLAYHDIIDTVIFEQQLCWLKSRYQIIDINFLKEHLFENKPLPPNSLLITLDDGDISVFNKALNIFKKYQIPSCLFIVTELIDSKKDFWWDTIKKNEKKKGLSGMEVMKIINYNKSIPNEKRLENLKKYHPTFKKQLTNDQLKILEENSVYIANHSHTHPMFNKLDVKSIHKELREAKIFFDNQTIGDYSVFAYPNGNYNESAEHVLETNGIKIAFLFDHKLNRKDLNPLRISRIAVDSNTELSEFKTKVSGLHPFILDIKKRFL